MIDIWLELGIPPTREARAIKLAYAARLKQVHPEDDPQAFQRLRSAYDTALALAAAPARSEAVPSTPPSPSPVEPQASQPPSPPPPQPERGTPAAPSPAPETAPELARTPVVAEILPALFDQLLAVPPPQRRRMLAEALKRPGWESLDFRAAFERSLPLALAANFEQLQPLVEVFSRHYGWSEGLQQLGGSGPQIGQLLARNAARLWRLEKENTTSRKTQPLRESLELLRGPVDAKAFARFTRHRANLRGMHELLSQMRSQCPAAAHFEVTAESFKWWSDYCAKRPPPSELSWEEMGGIALAILCLAFPIASRIGLFPALHSQPQHAPAALRAVRPGEDALVPVIGEDYVINWPADYAKALNLAVTGEMLRSPQRAVLHGKVGLRIRMRRDGTVIDSLVDASSGQAAADAEALAVIRRIGRFAPVPAKYSPGESVFNFHQPVDFGSG